MASKSEILMPSLSYPDTTLDHQERGRILIEARNPPSSVPKVSLQPGTDYQYLLRLFKDEVVEGKVLESYTLDRALLLLKGKKVHARTHVPLREGSVLSFKVQQVSPTPILRLIGARFTHADAVNGSIILPAIKQNLWREVMENMPQYGLPREALSLFRKLMINLSMRLFAGSSPELLKVFIDQSGFRWEAKLKEMLLNRGIGQGDLNELLARDLKGLSSKFLVNQEQKGGLERLISTIENVQLLNKFGLEQKGKLFFPIPLQFPDGHFTVGQLLIQLPQSQEDEGKRAREDGKRIFRITFLLELSRLGPLRADLALREKDITGKILITRQEAKSRIEKGLPILVDRMRERGFSIHSMECQLRKREIVTQSLLSEIIQQEGNTISLLA
jgi:hypothetical protein